MSISVQGIAYILAYVPIFPLLLRMKIKFYEFCEVKTSKPKKNENYIAKCSNYSNSSEKNTMQHVYK